MEKLDRTLDGEDMARLGLIELFHQRCNGGGFPRACGAGHNEQALSGLHQSAEVWVEIERLERGVSAGKDSNRESHAARGLEQIDATPHALQGTGEIERSAFDELAPFLRGEKRLSGG